MIEPHIATLTGLRGGIAEQDFKLQIVFEVGVGELSPNFGFQVVALMQPDLASNFGVEVASELWLKIQLQFGGGVVESLEARRTQYRCPSHSQILFLGVGFPGHGRRDAACWEAPRALQRPAPFALILVLPIALLALLRALVAGVGRAAYRLIWSALGIALNSGFHVQAVGHG